MSSRSAGMQDPQYPSDAGLELVHQQWVSTLDAIRDAIIVVDPEGRLVRANRSFADLAGSDVCRIAGSPIANLVPWLVDESSNVRTGQVLSPDGRAHRIRSFRDDSAMDGRVFILEDATDSLALERAEDSYREGTARSLIETIEALSRALEAKDPYTVEHSEHVAALAKRIALKMGLDEFEAQGIYYGGKVHDIGKLGIPSGILSKPGRLAQAEMNLIRTHCESGYAVVKHLDFPWPVHNIILQHHERLDGSGYPAGLRGDEIDPAARIVAVADVAQAMSSHRPYRAALGMQMAIAELEGGRGRTYDSRVVDAAVAVLQEDRHEGATDDGQPGMAT
ncbi:MAG: HD domain-containing phosphohydrolase [Pseudomonadota bacterium]